MGLRAFTPMVAACPGCGRTTSTFFQELAQDIQDYVRASDAGVAAAARRRREHDAGRHGLRRQRPRREQARQHRHLAAGHRRSAGRRRSMSTAKTRHDAARRATSPPNSSTSSSDYVAAHLHERNCKHHEPNTASRARDERHPARRSRTLGAVRGHRARLAARLRLSADPHADRRADAAVQARHRRSHRHRREGNVFLHRQPQRRAADAAPGRHGSAACAP